MNHTLTIAEAAVLEIVKIRPRPVSNSKDSYHGALLYTNYIISVGKVTSWFEAT